eukprot:Trichotokara_eunicae@DN2595_c0_g1_i1.p1
MKHAGPPLGMIPSLKDVKKMVGEDDPWTFIAFEIPINYANELKRILNPVIIKIKHTIEGVRVPQIVGVPADSATQSEQPKGILQKESVEEKVEEKENSLKKTVLFETSLESLPTMEFKVSNIELPKVQYKNFKNENEKKLDSILADAKKKKKKKYSALI